MVYCTHFMHVYTYLKDQRGDSVVNKLPANAEDTAQGDTIPGLERCPGTGNPNRVHYSCLKKIPWIGKLGGLQSMRSQRVRQD